MGVLQRNHVTIAGRGTPIVFSHGYGCDQNMWRYVAPSFERDYQTILFDHVGAGRSDLSAFDRAKYGSLEAYADDLLEIYATLGIQNSIFVGHSVSAMIGVIAALKDPSRFGKLILIGPSPCYINDGDYVGGFSRKDIEELLESLDSNYLGWSTAMAPAIMGNPDRPDLGNELKNSFCRTHPEIAKQFAKVTFLSDSRTDLPKLKIPTLILQCADDVIAPTAVGDFVHRSIPESTLVQMKATGHCPNLSAPEETVSLIRRYLENG